ncbi:hypothetical protein ACJMK2_018965 [Sinanodonta woodiana]|uniref:Centrosomal protein of 295 kDa n=1 Tax=Sinanodonta woodiana TaxID=1069815 RepID=A0ABD3UEY0_SINWO
MKAKKGRLKLSPNEEAQLIREETERRRKIRLQQVRAQCRDNAAKVRHAVKQEKHNQLMKLASDLKNQLDEEKEERIKHLEEQYENSLRSIGVGHKEAGQQIDHEAERQLMRGEEILRAEARGKAALEREQAERAWKDYQKNKSIIARKQALDVERERASEIAAMPPPPPDPLIVLEKIQQRKLVKTVDLEAFSTTRYHMLPEVAVDRAAFSQTEMDAKQAAIEEEERIKERDRERNRLYHDQLERARVRHNMALEKELLRQDYERIMHDLSDLQRADRDRRQKVVANIPKQVFEPPHIRLQDLEEKQNEMEQKFEDMYMAGTNYMGDISLVLDAYPPPMTPSEAEGLESTKDSEGTPIPEPTLPTSSVLRDSTNLPRKGQAAKPEKVLRKLMDRIKNQRQEWMSHSMQEVDGVEIHDVNTGNQTLHEVYRDKDMELSEHFISVQKSPKARHPGQGVLHSPPEKLPRVNSPVMNGFKTGPSGQTLVHPMENAARLRSHMAWQGQGPSLQTGKVTNLQQGNKPPSPPRIVEQAALERESQTLEETIMQQKLILEQKRQLEEKLRQLSEQQHSIQRHNKPLSAAFSIPKEVPSFQPMSSIPPTLNSNTAPLSTSALHSFRQQSSTTGSTFTPMGSHRDLSEIGNRDFAGDKQSEHLQKVKQYQQELLARHQQSKQVLEETKAEIERRRQYLMQRFPKLDLSRLENLGARYLEQDGMKNAQPQSQGFIPTTFSSAVVGHVGQDSSVLPFVGQSKHASVSSIVASLASHPYYASKLTQPVTDMEWLGDAAKKSQVSAGSVPSQHTFDSIRKSLPFDGNDSYASRQLRVYDTKNYTPDTTRTDTDEEGDITLTSLTTPTDHGSARCVRGSAKDKSLTTEDSETDTSNSSMLETMGATKTREEDLVHQLQAVQRQKEEIIHQHQLGQQRLREQQDKLKAKMAKATSNKFQDQLQEIHKKKENIVLQHAPETVGRLSNLSPEELRNQLKNIQKRKEEIVHEFLPDSSPGSSGEEGVQQDTKDLSWEVPDHQRHNLSTIIEVDSPISSAKLSKSGFSSQSSNDGVASGHLRWSQDLAQTAQNIQQKSSHMNEPSYNPRSSQMDEPSYNPRSSQMDEPSYNPRSSHMDERSYNPRSSQMDEPSYNPKSSHMDEPSYNPRSSHMDEPSYNPRSSQMDVPSFNPKSSQMDVPSFNPKSSSGISLHSAAAGSQKYKPEDIAEILYRAKRFDPEVLTELQQQTNNVFDQIMADLDDDSPASRGYISRGSLSTRSFTPDSFSTGPVDEESISHPRGERVTQTSMNGFTITEKKSKRDVQSDTSLRSSKTTWADELSAYKETFYPPKSENQSISSAESSFKILKPENEEDQRAATAQLYSPETDSVFNTGLDRFRVYKSIYQGFETSRTIQDRETSAGSDLASQTNNIVSQGIGTNAKVGLSRAENDGEMSGKVDNTSTVRRLNEKASPDESDKSVQNSLSQYSFPDGSGGGGRDSSSSAGKRSLEPPTRQSPVGLNAETESSRSHLHNSNSQPLSEYSFSTTPENLVLNSQGNLRHKKKSDGSFNFDLSSGPHLSSGTISAITEESPSFKDTGQHTSLSLSSETESPSHGTKSSISFAPVSMERLKSIHDKPESLKSDSKPFTHILSENSFNTTSGLSLSQYSNQSNESQLQLSKGESAMSNNSSESGTSVLEKRFASLDQLISESKMLIAKHKQLIDKNKKLEGAQSGSKEGISAEKRLSREITPDSSLIESDQSPAKKSRETSYLTTGRANPEQANQSSSSLDSFKDKFHKFEASLTDGSKIETSRFGGSWMDDSFGKTSQIGSSVFDDFKISKGKASVDKMDDSMDRMSKGIITMDDSMDRMSKGRTTMDEPMDRMSKGRTTVDEFMDRMSKERTTMDDSSQLYRTDSSKISGSGLFSQLSPAMKQTTTDENSLEYLSEHSRGISEEPNLTLITLGSDEEEPDQSACKASDSEDSSLLSFEHHEKLIDVDSVERSHVMEEKNSKMKRKERDQKHMEFMDETSKTVTELKEKTKPMHKEQESEHEPVFRAVPGHAETTLSMSMKFSAHTPVRRNSLNLDKSTVSDLSLEQEDKDDKSPEPSTSRQSESDQKKLERSRSVDSGSTRSKFMRSLDLDLAKSLRDQRDDSGKGSEKRVVAVPLNKALQPRDKSGAKTPDSPSPSPRSRPAGGQPQKFLYGQGKSSDNVQPEVSKPFMGIGSLAGEIKLFGGSKGLAQKNGQNGKNGQSTSTSQQALKPQTSKQAEGLSKTLSSWKKSRMMKPTGSVSKSVSAKASTVNTKVPPNSVKVLPDEFDISAASEEEERRRKAEREEYEKKLRAYNPRLFRLNASLEDDEDQSVRSEQGVEKHREETSRWRSEDQGEEEVNFCHLGGHRSSITCKTILFWKSHSKKTQKKHKR